MRKVDAAWLKGFKVKGASIWILSLILTIIPYEVLAMGGGVTTKAKSTLERFSRELLSLVPTLSVIALILLGIGYAMKVIEKDSFFRWGIGMIICGSAAQLTKMFFG